LSPLSFGRPVQIDLEHLATAVSYSRVKDVLSIVSANKENYANPAHGMRSAADTLRPGARWTPVIGGICEVAHTLAPDISYIGYKGSQPTGLYNSPSRAFSGGYFR
jgi:hypothetical protein